MGAFSATTGHTLPDRYIEGTCPICGFESARGDQCDNCGNQLDPIDLINPRSKIDGTPPVFRETNHLFLDLPAFAEQLTEWIERQRPLAPERPELLARAAQGPEAEADHARPRLGRADPGAARVRGARRQADLRLVRRGHRLPVGGRRVGREPRDARGLARLVAGPRRAPRVLHGQGQHRLPHGDLAEHPARLRGGRRARRGQGAADAARTTSSRASS